MFMGRETALADRERPEIKVSGLHGGELNQKRQQSDFVKECSHLNL